jgi:SAM-dependent methyltransferase
MDRVTEALLAEIRPTTTSALDVGCGPGRYLHRLPPQITTRWALDAHRPYLQRVQGARLLHGLAQVKLLELDDRSIDLVYALDFIEHLERQEALEVIAEMKRIAKETVVVFTPHGFQVQESDPFKEGADIWQTHRSGWNEHDLWCLGFRTQVWLDFDYGKEGCHEEEALWGVWRRE